MADLGGRRGGFDPGSSLDPHAFVRLDYFHQGWLQHEEIGFNVALLGQPGAAERRLRLALHRALKHVLSRR